MNLYFNVEINADLKGNPCTNSGNVSTKRNKKTDNYDWFILFLSLRFGFKCGKNCVRSFFSRH